ncbi:MAG: sigma-54-dependent Fis family transcriptional regulator, partial [Verrucomicrobiales bacterium]|nr:sigma-54-dependent Fis family transcriptional regulator [Verrucomicrobiales bacterium]
MRMLPPILVVDDEPNMRASLDQILRPEGYDVVSAESAERALEVLAEREVLMLITDARLGGMSGYELLRRVKERWPTVPVMVITAYATPRLAVEAIRGGAFDYLSKPFAPEELVHQVERCAERHRLVRENTALKSRAEQGVTLEQLIGTSPRMEELKRLIQTVAPSHATVLILGESGTGKELIAGCLHRLSRRGAAPYVRINCAAIPEALLESELFGHEKGAFTGAIRQKNGRVEEADGGTVFLDEIGDMSRSLQAKLLRFLEDGSFTRVGGNQELKVDVRVVTATNRDLVGLIRDGAFREDLFHRLNVVQFRPPPLRDRGEDVLALARHFLGHYCAALGKPALRLSKDAEEALLRHAWPGNVRELRNAIERAVILETGPEVHA